MEHGLMRLLFYLSEWFMRVAVTNLLWVVFNLPIIFIVINMTFVEAPKDVFILGIPLLLIAPFFLFPATVAMFALIREWFINKENPGPLVKGYIQYYRTNYKKSLLAGLLFSFVWASWLVGYVYFNKENLVMMMFYFIIGILFYVFTINFFSVNAHYKGHLRTLFKHTLFLTIGSPVLFLVVLVSSAFILYTSFYKVQILIPFFTVSLIAFISFSTFYKHYLNVIKKKMSL